MLSRLVERFVQSRQGNVAILFGLVLIPLFGVAGLALDYSRAVAERGRLQNMVDSAVLAGAAADTGKEVSTAQNFFDGALSATPVEGASASFSFNASTGVTGTAKTDVTSTLLNVLQIKTIPVSVTATAFRDKTAGQGVVCILLVDPTSSQSLLANSGAKITAPTCQIHVRSTANPAAIVNAGTALNVQRICVKGSRIIDNGGSGTKPETDCDAISDPFANKLPVVTVPTNCTVSGANYNANGSDVTLAPGNYCGANLNNPRNVYMSPGVFQNVNFNGSPIINMAPGLYIFKNTTIINSGATLNGSEVTLYFADANSKIQFNGNVTLNLSAPSNGTYAGILFYEPSGLAKSSLVFNDTANSKLNGLFYLPSRNVTINSPSVLAADKVTMVFNTLILNTTGWSFSSADKSMPASSGTPSVVLTH